MSGWCWPSRCSWRRRPSAARSRPGTRRKTRSSRSPWTTCGGRTSSRRTSRCSEPGPQTAADGGVSRYGLSVFGFLRNLSEIGKLPPDVREQLEAEGVLFTAGKAGVYRHFSGHVPGVYSASGVSRYTGGFGFSIARVVATLPVRADANLRSIDCPWDSNEGPGRATITGKGLELEIDLHGVDPAFSGS